MLRRLSWTSERWPPPASDHVLRGGNSLSWTRCIAAAVCGCVFFLSTAGGGVATVRTTALVGGSKTGGPALLPNGQYITPLLAPGSFYTALRTGLRSDDNADANGAVTTALSPDGKTLLVLTSGFNCCVSTTGGAPITVQYIDPITGKPSNAVPPDPAFQWIFVYDVSTGVPQKLQQIQVPNAYDGLAWDPSGQRFYFSGGLDDRIYIYKRGATGWIPDAPFVVLNHDSNDTAPQPTYDGGILKFTKAGSSTLARSLGLDFPAITAGVAISPDGTTLFAANMETDSISYADVKTRQAHEFRLFHPGSTKPLGEYPYWIQPHSLKPGGPFDKVYVTSLRDGQVVAISRAGRITAIDVGGEPSKTALTRDGRLLYVVNPDLDEVEVIDTTTDTLRSRISVARPGYRYRGSLPNSLTLNANGRYLYVTLAGENAVGVIDTAQARIIGRIPTGWYPSSVTLSPNGTRLFVAIPKSVSGPTPTEKGGYTPPAFPNPTHLDQYIYDQQKAGILTIPIPDLATLAYLSTIVDANDGFDGHGHDPLMAFLHQHIRHVIYITKENRTYDQVLGDLGEGNGDPRLTEFPQPVTPNFHALATRFGDLDNWYMPNEVSGDGWSWLHQGHANDFTNKAVPFDYSAGGFLFDWAQTVRGENVALPIFANSTFPWLTERMTTVADPTGSSTIMPGPKDVVATVGADDERTRQTGGFVWDSAIRAGLSVRAYGAYIDFTFFPFGSALNNPYYVPIDRHAFRDHVPQASPHHSALFGRLDPYYRTWDPNVPDEFRYEEWKREFDGFVKHDNLPNLQVLCMMEDHFGGFATNVGGLRNPTLEMASNDHAVGLLVDAVSHSKYWKDTAIFLVEDDSQDGPDHVDAHRSLAHVISPYSRGGVIHTNYNTTSMLHTIADILGMDYLGLNDANALPMDDAFTTYPNYQPYDAIIPGVLCQPPVNQDLVPECFSPSARKTQAIPMPRSPQWWEKQSRHMVFSAPDQNAADSFNRLVWEGVVGDGAPYPQERNRLDLSVNRAAVLRWFKPPVPLQ
jgi:YVTN family beta-propeller protein